MCYITQEYFSSQLERNFDITLIKSQNATVMLCRLSSELNTILIILILNIKSIQVYTLLNISHEVLVMKVQAYFPT